MNPELKKIKGSKLSEVPITDPQYFKSKCRKVCDVCNEYYEFCLWREGKFHFFCKRHHKEFLKQEAKEDEL